MVYIICVVHIYIHTVPPSFWFGVVTILQLWPPPLSLLPPHPPRRWLASPENTSSAVSWRSREPTSSARPPPGPRPSHTHCRGPPNCSSRPTRKSWREDYMLYSRFARLALPFYLVTKLLRHAIAAELNIHTKHNNWWADASEKSQWLCEYLYALLLLRYGLQTYNYTEFR